MRIARLLPLAALLAAASPLAAQEAPRRYSAPGAAAMSLVVPGAGQLYTGRPLLGIAFLGAAGGALAYGLLSERVTVECLERTTGSCPPGKVLRETTERPHRDAALVGVAAVALVSAVDAFHAARFRNARPVALARTGSGREVALAPPAVVADGAGVRVDWLRVAF